MGWAGVGVWRWGFSCQWLCLSRSPSTRPKFVLGLVRTQMAESTLGFHGSRAGQRMDTAQFPVELVRKRLSSAPHSSSSKALGNLKCDSQTFCLQAVNSSLKNEQSQGPKRWCGGGELALEAECLLSAQRPRFIPQHGVPQL